MAHPLQCVVCNQNPAERNRRSGEDANAAGEHRIQAYFPSSIFTSTHPNRLTLSEARSRRPAKVMDGCNAPSPSPKLLLACTRFLHRREQACVAALWRWASSASRLRSTGRSILAFAKVSAPCKHFAQCNAASDARACLCWNRSAATCGGRQGTTLVPASTGERGWSLR